jgi:signal peptidase I
MDMTDGIDGLRPTWLRIALFGRNPARTLWRVAALIIVSIIVFGFVLEPIRVQGISMLPTYRNRQFDFVNRLAYLFHEPRRGDVVAIRLVAGPHVMYMKRIVGLPGETVGFHRGFLLVNGKAMFEPYVKTPCDWELPPRTVAPDQVYVVGDNRGMPAIDHDKGMASRRLIVGKVLF